MSDSPTVTRLSLAQQLLVAERELVQAKRALQDEGTNEHRARYRDALAKFKAIEAASTAFLKTWKP